MFALIAKFIKRIKAKGTLATGSQPPIVPAKRAPDKFPTERYDETNNTTDLFNLPSEIGVKIFEFLPKKDQLNLILTCQTGLTLKDEYYRLELQEITNQLASDDVLRQLAQDSRLQFNSNDERIRFLKDNFLYTPIKSDSGKEGKWFVSGLFVNQQFFDVLIQLNCWKLISKEKLFWEISINAKNLKNAALNGSKEAFEAVLSLYLQGWNDSWSSTKDRIYSYLQMVLNLKLDLDKKKILIQRMQKIEHSRYPLPLTKIEQGVIVANDREFKALLTDKNLIQKEIDAGFRSLTLAIQTQQLEKIKLLLVKFEPQINNNIAQNLILAAIKEENDNILQVLLEFFHRYAKEANFIRDLLFLLFSSIEDAQSVCEKSVKMVADFCLKNLEEKELKKICYVFLTKFEQIKFPHIRPAAELRILKMFVNHDKFTNALQAYQLAIDICKNDEESFWAKKVKPKQIESNQSVLGNYTAVQFAIAAGNVPAVRWILSNQKNVTISNDLLVQAISMTGIEEQAHSEIIKILINKKKNINKNTEIKEILKEAIYTRKIAVVKAVCNKQAQKYLAKDAELFSRILQSAIKANNYEVVNYLLDICPNAHISITKILYTYKPHDKFFDAKILSRLLKQKSINLGKDKSVKEQGDALYFAIKTGRQNLVQLLLEHGCDPNCFYEEACAAPLALAIGQGYYDIAEILLKFGAESCPSGYTGYQKDRNGFDIRKNIPIVKLMGTYFTASRSDKLPLDNLLLTMLEKVKKSSKPYYKSVINSYPEKATCTVYSFKQECELFPSYSYHDFYCSLGSQIIINALLNKIPGALVEQLIDSLSIDVNCPIINRNNQNIDTVLNGIINYYKDTKSLPDKNKCAKEYILLLIKKGANLFARDRLGESVIKKLGGAGISIEAAWIRNASSAQLNEVLLEHIQLLNLANTGFNYHKLVRPDVAEVMAKNLYTLLANEKLDLSKLQLSTAQFCKILCQVSPVLAADSKKHLIECFAEKDLELTKKLFSYKDSQGETLLHYAVESSDKVLLMKLVILGIVDINQPDKFGNTPLHFIFKKFEPNTDMEMVLKYLLQHPRLDITAKNQKGQSVWNIIADNSRNNDFLKRQFFNTIFNRLVVYSDPALFDKVNAVDPAALFYYMRFYDHRITEEKALAILQSPIFDPNDVLKLQESEYSSKPTQSCIDGSILFILDSIQLIADKSNQALKLNNATLRFINRYLNYASHTYLNEDNDTILTDKQKIAKVANELHKRFFKLNNAENFFSHNNKPIEQICAVAAIKATKVDKRNYALSFRNLA